MTEHITWHVDVPPNTTVHVGSSSQEVETRIVPTQKHDGTLNEFYEVRYVTHSHREGKPHVFIGNGGHISDHIELEPSEVLSLLAWLRQEESKLEGLAKEQAE